MKKKLRKVVQGDNLIATFLRSVLASQAASVVDFGSSFLFYALILTSCQEGTRAWCSTAIGATLGGIINCIINYKFTFHASGQSVKAVMVKYLLVWTGSLLLNSYGTTAATLCMGSWLWLKRFGLSMDAIYAAAKLIVSLLVSWFWNFLLQRWFVYRRCPAFDRFAIRLLTPRRRFRHK